MAAELRSILAEMASPTIPWRGYAEERMVDRDGDQSFHVHAVQAAHEQEGEREVQAELGGGGSATSQSRQLRGHGPTVPGEGEALVWQRLRADGHDAHPD